MTNIPKYSVQYPVTVLMFFLGTILLGLISFTNLPINLFPDIRYPRITVVTETQGLAPEEVERRISEPLERLMAGIRNVQQVSSISRADQSVVMVDFVWGSDMDFALLDVKKASGDLREEYLSMNVLRFDPNAQPILTLGLTGGDSLLELKRLGEKTLKPTLEKVEGVAEAEIAGGVRPEVRIEVDAGYLSAYGFTVESVIAQLQNANINATGGWIEDANQRFIVRAVGEFQNVEEIGDVPAGYKGNTPIRLREVAEIRETGSLENSLVRVGGKPGVGISLYKEPDANTVLTVRAVRKTVESIRKDLPEEIEISEVYDQSGFISEAITEVKNSALYGILLAVFVLFYFLRNLRTTIIIGLAIPVSIIATFNLMYFDKLSLNIMTLGGLALGAGMLVDNAIVVMENIFRLRQAGLSPREASIQGCQEVGSAIASSTFTTCVVFFPIVYLRDVSGLLFKEQALTVVFSLLTSLIVALSFIPMLCSRLMRNKPPEPKARKWYNPFRWLSKLLYSDRVKDFYVPVLDYSLRHRFLVFTITAAIVAGSLKLAPTIKQEFIPKSDQPQFIVELAMPPGSNLDVTDHAVSRLEGKLKEFGDSIQSFYSEIGVPEESKRKAEEEARGPNTAKILVTLNSAKQPAPSALQIIQKLQEEAAQTWGLQAKYQLYANSVEGFFGTDKAALVLEVKGPRLDQLKQIASQLTRQIQPLPGLVNVRSNLLAGSPQVSIVPDRAQLAEMNFDVRQLGKQIRDQLTGQLATVMKDADGERDIIVEMRSIENESVDALSEIRIQISEDRAVKLAEIAKIEVVPGPLEILRRDAERRAQVLADLEGVKLSDAVASVRDQLDRFYLPAGYILRIGGEEESRLASFKRLRFALILALILVYMVMASLFESLLHPLIVLFSAPLAIVGVVGALLVTGSTLNLMAYIGIVMLAGIVVNNAIVLIDCVNRMREEGLSRQEAILRAAQYRLRPILMTTATTVIALLPLAWGMGRGAELRAPMAIAVIGGLVSSTLLTLIFIPVIYSWVDEVQEFIRVRIFRRASVPLHTAEPMESGE